MSKPKKDHATQLDMRKTAEKAARYQASHAEMLDPTKLVPGVTNIHPEPVEEPVMPQEVFINRLSLDGNLDTPQGHV